jgi:hypothetical protein
MMTRSVRAPSAGKPPRFEVVGKPAVRRLGQVALACLALVWGAALAAESATPARATPDASQRQQRAERAKARWHAADTNQDGQLSREEVERGLPRLAPHFDKLDVNGDGQLTRQELRAAHRARKGERPSPQQSAN